MATLTGTEIASSIRRSQVYQATHMGEQTLPYMNRSFISFTYGGKKIEDFNLIATISNNKLNRKGYAPFEDTVSTYSNLDGQYFWGSHYKANQLDFILATDGIDQKQLDDFLYWFKAGTIRTLILAEHPNRAIEARVFEPPTLNLLPFQHELEQKYANIPYKITTTLYKGEINLSFTMDEPHWYAKVNILGEKVDDGQHIRYENIWYDEFTNTNVDIFASQDALKILYEDGIPLGSMIETNLLLGNGAYANVQDDPETKVWTIADEENPQFFVIGSGARINGVVTGSTVQTEQPVYTLFHDAAIAELDEEATEEEIIEKEKELWRQDETYKDQYWLIPNGTYTGRIFGAIVTATDEGIENLPPEQYGYFFYSGTAPSPVEIEFTMTPIIDDESRYLTSPFNSKTIKKYNTITIESEHKQELRFTTPNLFTSYNNAIDVFDSLINGEHTWEQIITSICNHVRHPVVREWALKCIEYGQGESASDVVVDSNYKSRMKNCMSCLLINTNGTVPTVKFTFNSKNGEAFGEFKYRTVSSGTALPQNDEEWITSYGSILSTPIREDVGDMLRSNHIIIQDRNFPTNEGTIISWASDDPKENRKYTHRFKHDIIGGVSTIQIKYKNMYL